MVLKLGLLSCEEDKDFGGIRELEIPLTKFNFTIALSANLADWIARFEVKKV